MKTIHLFALVAVLTVAGVSSARAGEWGGCHKGGEWGAGWEGDSYFDHVGAFCKEHGVKFSHGYFYPGLVQKHFTEKWYDWHLETWLYMDPHAHCPYYWCEGHGVWYPIHYIEKVGPGAKGPGPVVGKPEGGPGKPEVGPGKPEGGPAVPPAPDAAVGGAKPPIDGAGAVAPPPTGDKAVAPAGGAPKAPLGDSGTGGPPPEPTSSGAERVARAQTAKTAPAGTFEDAIDETK